MKDSPRIPPRVSPGKMTISRPRGGSGDQYVSITIVDEFSRCGVVEIRVGLAVLTEALTGLAYQPVECRWTSGVAHIGKTREYKSEVVWVPDSYKDDRGDIVNAALAPFEVDGWVGSRADATNHHCRVRRNAARLGGSNMRVGFYRFVEQEAAQ